MKKLLSKIFPKKGSALIFAMITLTAMMIVAIASYEAAMVNNRTATDTDKSVSSFQAADSGVELVMKKINDTVNDASGAGTNSTTPLNNTNVGFSCATINGTNNVGVYTDTSIPGRIIKVYAYETNDETDPVLCTEPISKIKFLKSTGEYGGTIRAVNVAVENQSPCAGMATVTDAEGNVYGIVEINGRCWFAENLRITEKPNGSSLTLGVDYFCPPNTTNSGSDCTASTVTTNKFGYLYKWSTAMNGASPATASNYKARGICPEGWHIPSDYNPLLDDFGNLMGGVPSPAPVADSLKYSPCSTFWNTGCTGDNSTGFSALGVGIHSITAGTYVGRGTNARFWTSHQNVTNYSLYDFRYDSQNTSRISFGDDYAFSVRCVKD